MDGELVKSSPPKSEATYSEQFREAFPYYLAIGMTEEQYWDRDPQLAKYFRKAEEMRNEKRNQELWLQGMYIYEALCDVAPILHSFAKKGTKPRPYAEAPYPLNTKDKERNEEAKAKREHEKAKRYMEAFMASNNRRFATNDTTTPAGKGDSA